MGSATREAIGRARATVDGATGLTLADGEQLLAAARTVDGSLALRSALADPAAEPARKTALVAGVFSTALGGLALGVLTALVESRWSAPAQLVDGIEEIGIRVIVRASKGASIEDEIFAFSRAVVSDAELELALAGSLGSGEARAKLVADLLPNASPATIAILSHLVQSRRGRRTAKLLALAADLVAAADDAVVATVTAAVQPSAAQLERLTASLAAQYGRTPKLNLILDPSLIGGLRVQLGDELIDGSVATRLADLRLRLAG